MDAVNVIVAMTQKIAHYPALLIPKAYRDEPSVLNALYQWFFLGLFLRLIFMPFAFHGDLLSTYRRSYLLVFEGSLRYLTPHESIQAIMLWISSFITPIQDFFLWSGKTSVSNSYWLYSLDNSSIFSMVFLMKIPYLLFDIAICIVFLHIFRKEVDTGVRVFIFWILNPIVVFTVYIFGRFEVIPIFFLLLCIYYIKEHNHFFGGLSFGIAIISKYYALLLLPLLLIIFFDSWKDRIKYLVYTSIPVLAFNIIARISSGHSPSVDFAHSYFIDYVLGMNFVLGDSGQILYIFIIAYAFLLLFVYYTKFINNRCIALASFSLITFLLFYSTSKFHPQYFIWFIPFLAIYYGYYHDREIIELHCLQVVCFIVYTFYWGQALASWMFGSINPEVLKTVTAPVNFISYFYPGEVVLNIVRSILSAISIFMIIKIMYTLKVGHTNEA